MVYYFTTQFLNISFFIVIYSLLRSHVIFPPFKCVFPQKALDVIQMGKEDQELVFKMLAAILWLGNISFQDSDNENHIEVVNDEGMVKVFHVARNMV